MQFSTGPIKFLPTTDESKMERAEHLAKAISIPTISTSSDELSLPELTELNQLIEDTFPEIHEADYINFTQVSVLQN